MGAEMQADPERQRAPASDRQQSRPFLGGAVFSLIANRSVSGFDVLSLLIAFIGAALLLMVVRKAGYAKPRTR